MQVELDLVQVLQVLPNLLVDVVKLLVGVRSCQASWLILEKLRRVVVSRLEQRPRKPLHHDNLSLL